MLGAGYRFIGIAYKIVTILYGIRIIPYMILRGREFDLWFGVRGMHEILEAGNGPKTCKCFFSFAGQLLFSFTAKPRANALIPGLFLFSFAGKWSF